MVSVCLRRPQIARSFAGTCLRFGPSLLISLPTMLAFGTNGVHRAKFGMCTVHSKIFHTRVGVTSIVHTQSLPSKQQDTASCVIACSGPPGRAHAAPLCCGLYILTCSLQTTHRIHRPRTLQACQQSTLFPLHLLWISLGSVKACCPPAMHIATLTLPESLLLTAHSHCRRCSCSCAASTAVRVLWPSSPPAAAWLARALPSATAHPPNNSISTPSDSTTSFWHHPGQWISRSDFGHIEHAGADR